MRCAEIWGGTESRDQDLCSTGLTASLFSGSADGGRGGDIYYLSVCGSDRLTRVAVADVVGHGETVAAVSHWLYECMAARMNDLDGAGVLADLNTIALDRGLESMTTAAVVAYYLSDGIGRFVYAGHHPALLQRHGNGPWAPVAAMASDAETGLPLGVLDGARYVERLETLRPGDRMLIYTDGLVEAPAPDGTQFGRKRLLELLDQLAGEPLVKVKRSLVGALRAHTGGRLEHDDVTLIVLEVNDTGDGLA
ncbi:MAG: PP2C family protein-serine/threonine phosphatase [Planctomycetota bacterium]|jgi:sigma-B regulation protein RsbU (phosphoserine phosphatase)